MNAACAALRIEFALLEEERTLPKMQVLDILLDWRDNDPAVVDYIFWSLGGAVTSSRVFITWEEVDSALSDLEEG